MPSITAGGLPGSGSDTFAGSLNLVATRSRVAPVEAPADGEVPASSRRARPRLPVLLAGTDLAAVGIGALFTTGVRPPIIELGILAGALLALQAALGSYRPKLALSALDDLPTTLVVVMGAGAVETTWLAVLGRAPSSGATLVRVVVLALSVAVLRATAYAVLRTARRRGHFAHPTLVLGGGDTVCRVAVAAAARPEHGLAPLGIVGVAPADGEDLPVPFLGGYDVLEAVIRRWGVTEVVVAVDERDWAQPGSSGPAVGHGAEEAVRTAHGLGCAIFFVLRPFEPQRRGRDVDHLWGIPVVRVRNPKPGRGQWRVKRVFDAAVAGLTLVLLTPVHGLGGCGGALGGRPLSALSPSARGTRRTAVHPAQVPLAQTR